MPNYPYQPDDVGCFGFIGCVVCLLVVLVSLARALSWLFGTLT